MITKQELLSIPTLHRGMVDDVQRLRDLREKAICIPSPGRMNPNKVQNSRSNRSGIIVDTVCDLEMELTARHIELEELKGEAGAWISTHDDDRTRRILTQLFIYCWSIKHVAAVMDLTPRRVNQIRQKAIAELN